MIRYWLWIVIALIPCHLPSAESDGHVFYRHWDAEAQAACAIAVSRVTGPYRVRNSALVLLNETEVEGNFAELGLTGDDPALVAALVADFPSLANSTKFSRALKEMTAEAPLALSPFLPPLVRDPVLLRRPIATDEYIANCFGAAMGWFGYTNRWFSNDNDQLESVLKARFRKVARGNYLKPETMVVWRYAHDRQAFHVAVLLAKDMIWQRRGSQPAAFTTLGRAINAYGGRNGGARDAVIEFYRHVPSP